MWLHCPNCFHAALRETFTLYKLQRAGWYEKKNTCQIKYGLRNLKLVATDPFHNLGHSSATLILPVCAVRATDSNLEWRCCISETQSLLSFTAKLTEIINGPEDTGIMSLRNTDIQFQDYVISKRRRCECKSVWVRVGLPTFERSNKQLRKLISLFHRPFQFTIYNGPTNALACNKTLIQMSHTKTLKINRTCFDHQLIIIRELFDPG
jgi:hypothetical protein